MYTIFHMCMFWKNIDPKKVPSVFKKYRKPTLLPKSSFVLFNKEQVIGKSLPKKKEPGSKIKLIKRYVSR